MDPHPRPGPHTHRSNFPAQSLLDQRYLFGESFVLFYTYRSLQKGGVLIRPKKSLISKVMIRFVTGTVILGMMTAVFADDVSVTPDQVRAKSISHTIKGEPGQTT